MSGNQKDLELEQEFRNLVNKTNDLLEVELIKAKEALDKAIKISNESGIPFTFNNDTYYPRQFAESYNSEIMEEITGEYFDREYEGWGWKIWDSSNC